MKRHILIVAFELHEVWTQAVPKVGWKQPSPDDTQCKVWESGNDTATLVLHGEDTDIMAQQQMLDTISQRLNETSYQDVYVASHKGVLPPAKARQVAPVRKIEAHAEFSGSDADPLYPFLCRFAQFPSSDTIEPLLEEVKKNAS